MDERARLIAIWCRQARSSGALYGDMCWTQLLALDILDAIDEVREYRVNKSNREFADAKFMDWLAVEHREVYEAVQKAKLEKDERDSYVDISELKADDMKELITKMRRKAAMESDSNRG